MAIDTGGKPATYNGDLPGSPRHRPSGRRLDWLVFGITSIGSVAFVLWGIIDQDSLANFASNAQSWVITNTGWMFVLVATSFVVYVIWLALSRYGKIPLGADGEQPEFRTVSWIAMMFSAGMGIGLMFWGVAEPLTHFTSPPPGTAEAGSPQAAEVAMATTLFHWTLHPWAIYAVAGLAIAYGTFRRGRSQLFSSVFRPLLGRHADGWGGKAIDMMAIFATLFGSAASLGLGALQIGAGLEFNGWMDTVGKLGLVVVIAVLTVAFIVSAVSGVARGIQWLSNINMVLAVILA
ncbi:MAG: BCCT family transporter, partial [Nocardia sp.]|nr:BCCT family transporter [Nocardia sp.]